MKVKIDRDVRANRFFLRFSLINFSDDDIYYISRYGPFRIQFGNVTFRSKNQQEVNGNWNQTLDLLSSFEFVFENSARAKEFERTALNEIKRQFESFIAGVNEYVGESLVEIRAGEEIKIINEGARKALDRNSKEYEEVIAKNREAFEKLSKE